MSTDNTDDVVNHPNHYNQYDGFEVIDVCEQLRAPDGTGNYNRGNAFKYLARAGWKNAEKHVEDLEKAKFYIQREIDRVATDKSWEATPAALKTGFPEANGKNTCPECGILLVEKKHYQPHCPNLHGWLDKNDIWHPPFAPQPVEEVCTTPGVCNNPNHVAGVTPWHYAEPLVAAPKNEAEDLSDMAQYGVQPEPVTSKSTASSTCGVDGCIEHPIAPKVVGVDGGR